MSTDAKTECGPENCPLTAWAALSPSERKAQRQSLAHKLYEQGFTMEAIAGQFGVSHKTISQDLSQFVPKVQIKKHAVTPGNPKGAGRPKSKRKAPESPAAQQARMLDPVRVYAAPDAWKRFKDQALAEGIPAAEKLGKLIEEPEIDRAALSLTAQQKLDMAIRQHKRKLDMEFEARVQEEINQRLEHIVLPVWRRKIVEAKKIYDNRHRITNKETFNLIVRCLHTDTRKHVGDDVANEAFTRFMSLEKFLLNEKDSPTKFTGLPTTPAEWEQRKQEAAALRRVKRGHTNVSHI